MPNLPLTLLLPLFASAVFAAAPGPALEKATVLTLEWTDLVPADAREQFSSAPAAATHDYLGEAGPAAVQQSTTAPVNNELNGKVVKIPGFIVPLDVAKDGTVSEFFLVPYFGACIHVPPPPPNQIVYVTTKKGIALDSIYEAYWITGTMKLQGKNSQLGSAAYSLSADNVEIYKY
jgi:hypothetical protein